ncbi:hypothetical protein C2G38_2218288 [Gigaspora rosea]|uniref:Signal transduction histidine kinase dimerisation/phosphoacceptor domain-containing protein n=1 Tax=Gigaspora rosea TaxID=44941 RepID=A0A397UA34_9GLOM|nr:hypothetical protein C2G38_2218288 [Gigaspora rosea]
MWWKGIIVRSEAEMNLVSKHRQETIKQFLITITEIIYSEHNLIGTLSNIIKVIHNILPCDRVFIISYEPSTSSTSNSTLVALYKNLENITPIAESFQDEEIINLYPQNTYSQPLLNNNSGIEILLNTYCANTWKNFSMLSAEIRMNSGYWGCIKLHWSSNSIWLNSEIELLQQSNKKRIQIKAETFANKTKTQILANTSHELQIPLETIIGLISLFDFSTLTDNQKDMIDIVQHASDSVLFIVNNILNAAKLEAQQIASINTIFLFIVFI